MERNKFKIGDWVIGWFCEHLEYRTKPWQIGKFTNRGSAVPKGTTHNTGIVHLKHVSIIDNYEMY